MVLELSSGIRRAAVTEDCFQRAALKPCSITKRGTERTHSGKSSTTAETIIFLLDVILLPRVSVLDPRVAPSFRIIR
jgi:hypothetical protein